MPLVHHFHPRQTPEEVTSSPRPPTLCPLLLYPNIISSPSAVGGKRKILYSTRYCVLQNLTLSSRFVCSMCWIYLLYFYFLLQQDFRFHSDYFGENWQKRWIMKTKFKVQTNSRLTNAENTLFIGQTAEIYIRFWNVLHTNPQTQPPHKTWGKQPHLITPFSLQRKQFSGSELIWLWLMEQSVQEGRVSTSERQWPKDPCYCIYPACRRIAGPRFVCLSVCVCWAFVVQCLLAWRFSIESVVLEVISLSHGLQHIQGSTMAKMSEFSMLLAELIWAAAGIRMISKYIRGGTEHGHILLN